MDRSRRRTLDVTALPAEAAQNLEKLQTPDIQCSPTCGQLNSDKKRSQNFPLPFEVCTVFKSKDPSYVYANDIKFRFGFRFRILS